MQSCIAAVISAYHNGSSILRRITAERQARRALPLLTELEQSVDQAPTENEADQSVQKPTFTYEAGEDDPFRIWGEDLEDQPTDSRLCPPSSP